MKRRTCLTTALGLGAGLLGARSLADDVGALRWSTRPLVALGTTVRLHVAHPRPAQAEGALDAAVAVLREVEASMSLFRPDSELVRLNRAGRLSRPSRPLLTVLREACTVAAASGGAFDPTVQPLWRCHDDARAAGVPAHAAAVEQARRRVDWRALHIDDAEIRLMRPGMALTLNGIAQGYAADTVRAALQAHGIEHALVDTGEFSAWGHNERGQPWRLGLEHPRDDQRLAATVLLRDGRSLATSADHRSAFTSDRRLHHVIDPATGVSPPALASVSVLADSALRADALTKVMMIGGPDRLPDLARQWQVGVWWVDKQGRSGSATGLPVDRAPSPV